MSDRKSSSLKIRVTPALEVEVLKILAVVNKRRLDSGDRGISRSGLLESMVSEYVYRLDGVGLLEDWWELFGRDRKEDDRCRREVERLAKAVDVSDWV